MRKKCHRLGGVRPTLWFGFDDSVWIERDDGRSVPFSGLARPSPRVSSARLFVDAPSSGQDRQIASMMPVIRGDIPDGAMEMFLVVPSDETFDPRVCIFERIEATSRI